MSKYKDKNIIEFDTPEQREQIVEKLENDGYKVNPCIDADKCRGLKYGACTGKWFYFNYLVWSNEEYKTYNITDKFWDEYEAEQDLTICLEGDYCPRYYKVEFTVEDSIEFFIDNLNFNLPDSSIHPVNGVVTLVIDVKTKSTYTPSIWETSGLQSCIEIITVPVKSSLGKVSHISRSTKGLVAKAKDIDNYNKWLDAVKFNRSQEFEVLTEGFEESLEIIDSLYKRSVDRVW